MKDDKTAKRSSFGSMMRRRLSDITNSMPQHNTEKPQPAADSSKDYIAHLVKENMTLFKLVQEKNKIIELSGVEIQKMRTCLQKMQLQNWSLAQSNGHMLAELNLNRERVKLYKKTQPNSEVKALQHEIVCKEALIKTKNLQVKDHEVINRQKTEVQSPKESGVATEASVTGDANKGEAATRNSCFSRSRSLGSWKTSESQQHPENEVLLSKRRRVGRKSSNSRTRNEKELEENMFEIDDAKFPVSVLSGKERVRRNGSLLHDHGGEGQRRSISRPLRKAVEKVDSYKERSLNSKMRQE